MIPPVISNFTYDPQIASNILEGSEKFNFKQESNTNIKY